MDYEWDSTKAASNVLKHHIAFDTVVAFEWDTAVVVVDDRRNYGEARFLASGMIGSLLHSLAFTLRNGKIRVISLRIAGTKERRLYDEPR